MENKLKCKTDFILEEKILFEKDKWYYIDDIINTTYSHVDLINNKYNIGDFGIVEFFYTYQELRKIKIEKLLKEGN